MLDLPTTAASVTRLLATLLKKALEKAFEKAGDNTADGLSGVLKRRLSRTATQESAVKKDATNPVRQIDEPIAQTQSATATAGSTVIQIQGSQNVTR